VKAHQKVGAGYPTASFVQTKPIFGIPKMGLTNYKIRPYNKKSRLSIMQKRSQTKPIKANFILCRRKPVSGFLQIYRYTAGLKIFLNLVYCVVSEMSNRGHKNSVSIAYRNSIVKMFEFSRPQVKKQLISEPMRFIVKERLK
jgi:hypothetical protein